MKVSRRSVVGTAGSGLGAGILAACGVGTSAPRTEPGGGASGRLSGTFEFWQPWPIEQPTHGGPIGWKQLSENYNAKGGPRVNIISPAGAAAIETPLQTAFAGGNPPDGWQADQLWVPVWAAKGFAAPLDDLIKRDKWDKNQIFSSAYETMSWQGKVWAMMQHPDIVFNWLSISLMEDNGLNTRNLPANWTQLDELMLKLTKRTGPDQFEFVGGIPNGWTNWQYVLPQANGAKMISEDGRKAQLDSPEVIEAMEWVKGHIKRLGSLEVISNWRKTGVQGGDNYTPGTDVGLNDIFGQKKMAANIGGNWTADNVRRWNRKMQTPLKFATTPIPSGPKGPRDTKVNVFSGGILEHARKGGPKLDLMWDFMKYTASKEGGYWVQLNTSDVCTSREGARDPRIIDNPDTGVGRKDFLPFFDTGVGSRTIKHPAAIEIQAEYNRPLGAYLRDEIGNIRDALREANRLAQGKIDDFWAQNPNAGK
jgi:ABC-type glycerol-3-phosphate transport system substrate-binding protein